LKEAKSFSSISFLPQQGFGIRAPKNVEIRVRNDEKTWTVVANKYDICTPNSAGDWHKINLQDKIKVHYLKISINENCGQPHYPTLCGLKFD
jgi:hypothetical protein